jgi:hypothetical protein
MFNLFHYRKCQLNYLKANLFKTLQCQRLRISDEVLINVHIDNSYILHNTAITTNMKRGGFVGDNVQATGTTHCQCPNFPSVKTRSETKTW